MTASPWRRPEDLPPGPERDGLHDLFVRGGRRIDCFWLELRGMQEESCWRSPAGSQVKEDEVEAWMPAAPTYVLQHVEEEVSTGQDAETRTPFPSLETLLCHLRQILSLSAPPGTPGFAAELGDHWEWISALAVQVETGGAVHILGHDEVARAATSRHAMLALEARFRR